MLLDPLATVYSVRTTFPRRMFGGLLSPSFNIRIAQVLRVSQNRLHRAPNRRHI